MDKPLRILCVFSTLDRGGAESMCMNLYRHIDRTKVQFDFVKHTSEKGAFENEIIAMGGRIYAAPRYKIINQLQYTKWWREHFRNHPEHMIIHGHFFTISAVFLRIAKECGRITIGHSHCTPGGIRSAKNEICNFLLSKVERYSDYSFACSQPAGEWIFPNKKFIVLNNAIDSTQFVFNQRVRNEVRKELRIENSFVVGTVGRIMHQKNPIGIVDIFKTIKDKEPNAILLWVGDGPMRRDAERRIEAFGLQKSVLMLGVRSDVDRLMQAMDVFIFPSYYEGLGVVAIEAQASGLQCFCSDQVPKEAAVTGRCHFLPLGQTEAWADMILKTECNHVDTQDDIIATGYDIHQTAEWLCNFYETIGKKDGAD